MNPTAAVVLRSSYSEPRPLFSPNSQGVNLIGFPPETDASGRAYRRGLYSTTVCTSLKIREISEETIPPLCFSIKTEARLHVSARFPSAAGSVVPGETTGIRLRLRPGNLLAIFTEIDGGVVVEKNKSKIFVVVEGQLRSIL
ncbi:hypothetical protein DBV15_00075 [Temnothorax longispinosus]|uniref:Uncharacterized protein n=1 Tax=Temnothorax longispinosus TaxID=300112 RepID=A0A4V3SA26_9HYME|nr:hypothetical protein DBV15_00075 [Temnothorax longispinosus]